jgi:hypothetical protein
MNIIDLSNLLKEVDKLLNGKEENTAALVDVKCKDGGFTIVFTNSFPKDVIHNTALKLFSSNEDNHIVSAQVSSAELNVQNLVSSVFHSYIVEPLYSQAQDKYVGCSKKSLHKYFVDKVSKYIDVKNQELISEIFDICLSDLVNLRYLAINEIGFVWNRTGMVETLLNMGVDQKLIERYL